MEIVHYQPAYKQETEAFLKSIFKEMGWKVSGRELTNLYEYFHLPKEGFLLIAKENNEIIGTAGCLKLNGKDALMKRFYIHSSHRGKGVAKKLLDEFIKIAKSMNLSRIVLDVSKNNTRAIRFYEKSGFIRYHQDPISQWPESFLSSIQYYYFLDL